MKLKDYEHRYDYTVKGKPFAEGFKELYYEYVRFGSNSDSVLYLNLYNGVIDYTADEYLPGYPVILFELCDAEGHKISDCWTVSELEEFLSNDEIKNLRQKFIDENDYQDVYTCDEDFLEDKENEYIDFIFDQEVPAIEKGVKEWIDDTYNLFLEQYDDAYWKLSNKEF